MVRELPHTNSEQGMYGKHPALYEDLDDGSNPINLGVTLKLTRSQWNKQKNGRGGGEL